MTRPEEKAVLMRRRGNALAAVDARTQEVISKIPGDADVYVWVKQARNPAHHRKFMSLVDLIHKHQTKYPSRDILLDAIKIAVGHCDTFIIKDGTDRVGVRPRSIAFEAMGQQEFSDFYERVLDIVVAQILPGVTKEDLRKQLLEYA